MMKGYASNQKKDEQKYQTIQDMPAGRAGADMIPKALYEIQAIDFIATGGGVNFITDAVAAPQVKAGDVIRITGGTHDGIEVGVLEVKGDDIYLNFKFSSAILVGDTFKIMRYITLTISKAGELVTSSGPVQFVKDGISQVVTEDTVTPANNAPLPVKLTGVTGDVNITAGDLNVQTSHLGATFDSQRIGDGVTELGITLANEAKVSDADALAEALLLKTAVAKEAKQDAANLLLTSLDGKDISTATKQDEASLLLTSLDGKDISTATKQDEASLLLTSLDGKDISTATKQDEVKAAINLATSLMARETKQDISILSTDAILAKLSADPSTATLQNTNTIAVNAIFAELEKKADLTETQPVSVLGVATEAKQDAMLAELSSQGAREVHQVEYATSQALTLVGITPVSIVVGVAVNIKEVTIAYQSGASLEVTFGGAIIGYVTQGGGSLPTNFIGDGVKTLGLRALKEDVTVSELVINLIK